MMKQIGKREPSPGDLRSFVIQSRNSAVDMRVLSLAVAVAVLAGASAGPADRVQSKFFFDGKISRVTNGDQSAQAGSSIKFVPLITLIAGLFPNLMSRLGQYAGVNKQVNVRELDRAVTPHENQTESLQEEPEPEEELLECDGDHLGLWPDKSDSQRYYKCEIDPRIPSNSSCMKDLFRGKHMEKAQSQEKVEVPGVKPCFLLSMMKCANGFRYQHKTRICVPDIVFATAAQ